MTPDEIALREHAKWVRGVNRALWVAAALLAAFAVGLITGCASDLDDMETMTSDSTTARVWRATWGDSLGEPPPVSLDDGHDQRCADPRAFWSDDGCYFGVFNPREFSVRLPREIPGNLAHELAHAAMFRMGAPFDSWSAGHTTEFWRQACRGLYHHKRVAVIKGVYPECSADLMAQIAREEGP